jgi:tRNA G46 methylase TrmB
LCSPNSIVSTISLSEFDKVVIEIGIGDGQLLDGVIDYENSPNTCYIGVEIESSQICKARDRMAGKNIFLINESIEEVIPSLPDNSVDQFIFVLPPPIYIDRELESQWTLLYQKIYKKLKEKGNLTLVTEVTNDLLEPVSNDEFISWKTWLASVFVTLGFTLVEVFNECPLQYRSHFLEQFKADQLRIKIITLILEKPDHKSI